MPYDTAVINVWEHQGIIRDFLVCSGRNWLILCICDNPIKAFLPNVLYASSTSKPHPQLLSSIPLHEYSFTVRGSDNKRLSASCHCCLWESSSAWQCHCNCTLFNLDLLSASDLVFTYMCATVDSIPECYRQNWDSTSHLTILCLTFHTAITAARLRSHLWDS